MLAPGDYLFHQGQVTDRFCVVYDGLLDVMTTNSDGRELVFTTLGPGEPIGEAAIIEGVPRTASILAKSAATVLSITRDSFLSLAEAHGPIALSLARLSARTLRRLSTRIEAETFADLDTRIIQLLLELAEPDKVTTGVIARTTQQTLADRLGVTRESINKHLRGLAAANLVSLERGTVTIPDPAAVEDLIHR